MDDIGSQETPSEPDLHSGTWINDSEKQGPTAKEDDD